MDDNIVRNVYRFKDLIMVCNNDIIISLFIIDNDETIPIDLVTYEDSDKYPIEKIKDMFVVKIAANIKPCVDENGNEYDGPVLDIYLSDKCDIVYVPNF